MLNNRPVIVKFYCDSCHWITFDFVGNSSFLQRERSKATDKELELNFCGFYLESFHNILLFLALSILIDCDTLKCLIHFTRDPFQH